MLLHKAYVLCNNFCGKNLVLEVYLMNFSIYNFGCKVNQYESQVMTELMIKKGYEYTVSLTNPKKRRKHG